MKLFNISLILGLVFLSQPSCALDPPHSLLRKLEEKKNGLKDLKPKDLRREPSRSLVVACEVCETKTNDDPRPKIKGLIRSSLGANGLFSNIKEQLKSATESSADEEINIDAAKFNLAVTKAVEELKMIQSNMPQKENVSSDDQAVNGVVQGAIQVLDSTLSASIEILESQANVPLVGLAFAVANGVFEVVETTLEMTAGIFYSPDIEELQASSEILAENQNIIMDLMDAELKQASDEETKLKMEAIIQQAKTRLQVVNGDVENLLAVSMQAHSSGSLPVDGSVGATQIINDIINLIVGIINAVISLIIGIINAIIGIVVGIIRAILAIINSILSIILGIIQAILGIFLRYSKRSKSQTNEIPESISASLAEMQERMTVLQSDVDAKMASNDIQVNTSEDGQVDSNTIIAWIEIFLRVLNEIITIIVNKIQDIIAEIVDIITSFVNIFIIIINSIIAIIASIVQGFVDKLNALVDVLTGSRRNGDVRKLQVESNTIIAWLEIFVRVLNEIINIIVNKIQDIIAEIIDIITSIVNIFLIIINSILAIIGSIVQGIVDKLNALVDVLTGSRRSGAGETEAVSVDLCDAKLLACKVKNMEASVEALLAR